MKKKVLIVLIVILLSGCGPRFYYNQLDWLVPFYLSDYISLNSDQKTVLKDRLRKQIAWHCRTQLAKYSATLRALSDDISNVDHSIDTVQANDYYLEFKGYWTSLIRQVAPDIAEILRSATDAQIQELFDNLDKRGEEIRAEYIDISPEELVKHREEHMNKALRRWLSTPTPEQEQAVAAWSKKLKPLGSDWLIYRDKIQEEAMHLLKQRKDLPDFERRFTEILVHTERMRTVEFQEKTDYNTHLTIKLAVEINHLMTPEQRTHLLKRINSLADDFETIKCNS
jgi:Family of unknown function (DUF6279)